MDSESPGAAAHESGSPVFRTLSDAEARAILARHHVGRIAYTFRDRVDIEPIHYAADGDWIYGRTSIGTKLATLAHHPWCAFEVDEVRGLFDWESVVAKGTFYLLDPEVASPDASARALTLLRELVPGTLSAHDPAPHRTVLFRIHVNELTGRAAHPGAP
jgi:nitroimidazol reductase NimA-like FMN-containing flavoprotein (pyridoxamine 5'-phosphate oxidase superfamily)